MNYLIDTSVLIRLSDPTDEFFDEATDTVDHLHVAGNNLVVAPQVVYEYWSASTRPVARRGLGLSPGQVRTNIEHFNQTFEFADEPIGLYREWLNIVTTLLVSGKESHDARLVAFMNLSNIQHIVTFNTVDFARYPTVTAIDPRTPQASL